jgi:hypothetical protein
MRLVGGDPSAAAEAFTSGVAAPSVVQYLDRARLLAGLGMALSLTGDTERAETILDELREYASDRWMATSAPLLALADGHLAAATGDAGAAEASMREALGTFDAMDARWLALLSASAIAEVTGQPADVEETERRARAMAADIIDDDLRQSFLARWADTARAEA